MSRAFRRAGPCRSRRSNTATREDGIGAANLPPNRPTTTISPPRRIGPLAKLSEGVEPTKSTRSSDAAARVELELLQAVSLFRDCRRRGAAAIAASSFFGSMSQPMILLFGNMARANCRPIMPTPPRRNDGDGLAFISGADLLQRRVGRDAQTHVGGGEAFGIRRSRRAGISGAGRGRRRIAASNLDAELTRLVADVLLVALAGGALAAADPREDDKRWPTRAAFEQGLRVRADSRERAFDFVTERVRQRAALGPVRLARRLAEIDMAVLKVDVRVADAGEGDLGPLPACRSGPGCRR